MDYTASEVLQFVEENDVGFVRLAFCDIFGNQKNISIMPDSLPRAFESGIGIDASAVPGFSEVTESDLLLFPDPATLAVLPWRPSHGRVVRFFCDVKRPDGTAFEGDGRGILRRAVAEAADMGYTCQIGPECEFYLTERDENGEPTLQPHDHAGYLDIAPLDKGENVRREICLTLAEMGIRPESSHHEQGPGQNEIDFAYDDALRAADNLVTFKSVVKTIAARNGLFASFMPKLYADRPGSGLHINLSLAKEGVNIFKTGTDEHSQAAESFIAGVLAHCREITVFCNPLTNSYARFGKLEAPEFVSWSHQNRSQLVRIPAAKGKYSRMEYRGADPSCNPYWAFALLIRAGLDGIRSGRKLGAACDLDLYTDGGKAAGIERLPEDLGEAIALAKQSTLVAECLPAKTLSRFFAVRQQEWDAYEHAENKEKFERGRYFLRT